MTILSYNFITNEMFTTKEKIHICSVKSAYSMLDIQHTVSQNLQGICTKQDGFYRRVKNVVILSAKASVTGLILCRVKCQVDLFVPQVGQVVDSIVERCINDMGIYCIFEGMNILIPFRSLKECQYRAQKFVFNNGQEIQEKDVLSVRVEKTRYQNGKYKALGIIMSN